MKHPSRLAVAALRIIVLTTTMKWFALVLSFPLSVLGGQSQFPVHHADAVQNEFDYKKSSRPSEFSLKEGRGVFSPTDLVELPRPDLGIPNPSGDLLLIHVTKYFVEERRYDRLDLL